MALVDIKDMTTLRTAAQSKASASTALDEQQLKAVAYAINSAVNAGENCTEFLEPMREATQSALEGKGYQVKNIGIANKETIKLISWK